MSQKQLVAGEIREIPISMLKPDPLQPRQAFRQKPLNELANNIRSRGILQPITVVPANGKSYMIKMGERRYRAAQIAGLKTVPCTLDATLADSDAQDILIDQLSENDLRENLDPIERARAYDRLRDEGLGPTEISNLLAKHGIQVSRPAVSNTLRLLKLPAKAQKAVTDGTIKEAYARQLATLSEYPEIVSKATDEILAEKWEPVDAQYVTSVLFDLVSENGELLKDPLSCGKKSPCLLSIKDWNNRTVVFCMDPEHAAERELKRSEKEARAAKRASKNGASNKAAGPDPQRDERKAYLRSEAIRGLIDDALVPYLTTVATSPPLCTVLLTPLLTYVAIGYPVCTGSQYDNYSHYFPHAAPEQFTHSARTTKEMLLALPRELKTGSLAQVLSSELEAEAHGKIVAAIIRSLHLEQRRELAHYLNIDVTDFWLVTHDYAKLFTKPEIIELIGKNFEGGGNRPAGEWRQRMVDEGGVSDLVRSIWDGPIANVEGAEE
ncbi:MAG TPA: ParB/RepB/Spo0J family partition protein [Woeseiaceae bacterium]|nr:ParB/RepB/Spo0J family partition protein [Woeseiaceae bacterium]